MPAELKEEEESKEIGGSGKIDERFTVVTIEFKPETVLPESDTVSIMGEFTNWMPEIMERYDSEQILLEPEKANTFLYRSKLLRGYKYRYYFSVGDEFIVDPARATSEDRLGKITNFVDVADAAGQ